MDGAADMRPHCEASVCRRGGLVQPQQVGPWLGIGSGAGRSEMLHLGRPLDQRDGSSLDAQYKARNEDALPIHALSKGCSFGVLKRWGGAQQHLRGLHLGHQTNLETDGQRLRWDSREPGGAKQTLVHRNAHVYYTLPYCPVFVCNTFQLVLFPSP